MAVIAMILFTLLILLSVGTLSAWPFSRAWEYSANGARAVLLIMLLILLFL